MLKNLLILTILLQSLIAFAQDFDAPILTDTLAKRNKVKTVKRIEYLKGDVLPTATIKETYDTNGRLIKRVVDGNDYYIFYYDSLGQLTKVSYKQYDEYETNKYTYYDNGRLKYRYYRMPDATARSKDKWMYFIDDAGHLTSAQRLTYFGKNLAEYADARYDSLGRMIYYEASDEWSDYVYNADGFLVKHNASGGSAYHNVKLWFYNADRLLEKHINTDFRNDNKIYRKTLFHYFYNAQRLPVKQWETEELVPPNSIPQNKESIYRYTFY